MVGADEELFFDFPGAEGSVVEQEFIEEAFVEAVGDVAGAFTYDEGQIIVGDVDGAGCHAAGGEDTIQPEGGSAIFAYDDYVMPAAVGIYAGRYRGGELGILAEDDVDRAHRGAVAHGEGIVVAAVLAFIENSLRIGLGGIQGFEVEADGEVVGTGKDFRSNSASLKHDAVADAIESERLPGDTAAVLRSAGESVIAKVVGGVDNQVGIVVEGESGQEACDGWLILGHQGRAKAEEQQEEEMLHGFHTINAKRLGGD